MASTSQATGTSQATTLFAVPTPASESTSEPYYDLVPLASFTKDGREFVIWKDKSTQTEWLYKTNGERDRLCPPHGWALWGGGGLAFHV